MKPIWRNKWRNGTNGMILALALPAIVSNITTPLLSLIDVAIVGHIGQAAYIGAIAVGGAMFNMLYWLFGFLRLGTVGLTAQAYGAGRGTSHELWQSLLVATALGVLLILFQQPLGAGVLAFMDADSGTAALANVYFSIGIWGAPAVLCGYALAGWLVGMQNSAAMMWVAMATDVANILISLVLVFGFGLDIRGVAAGTVVAQYVGVAVAATIVYAKYRPVWSGWAVVANWTRLRRFFTINIDIFLRTVCLVAVTLWFTHAGAAQGAVVLAANAVLMQLFMLFSYFMDGFAFAGEALAGRMAGAADALGLRRVVRRLFAWGVAMAVVFGALYLLAGQWFMGVLTDDGAVQRAAAEYLPWAVSVPVLGFAAFVWDGVYIGLTLTRLMLVSMALAAAAFFAVYFLLYPVMGNHGLWLAFVCYLAVRGLAQSILYKRAPKNFDVVNGK